MKRITLLAAAAAVLAVTAASAAATVGHTAKATTIQLRHTSVGTILTTAGGRTIYVFGRDARNRDRCAAISGCTGLWPLVTSSGHPVAGRGVTRRLLGTIRVHGATQVTYGGRPLYTYSADTGPGQTSYVGVRQFGGVWDAISARGRLVR